MACGQTRRRSGRTRKEKAAGKLSANTDSGWESGHSTNRTSKVLTFFEDSVDRKTQQCVLKEETQLALRLPPGATGPRTPELRPHNPHSQAVRGKGSAYGLGAYVYHKGIDVVLSFGQLIEEGHNVEPRVLQQPEPQRCGVEERPRSGAAMPSAPGPVPSAPSSHPVLLPSHTYSGL